MDVLPSVFAFDHCVLYSSFGDPLVFLPDGSTLAGGSAAAAHSCAFFLCSVTDSFSGLAGDGTLGDLVGFFDEVVSAASRPRFFVESTASSLAPDDLLTLRGLGEGSLALLVIVVSVAEVLIKNYNHETKKKILF